MYDVKNHADLRACYPPQPLASVGNILFFCINLYISLPSRRSYGFVTQSFLSHNEPPKNVCVGGYLYILLSFIQ